MPLPRVRIIARVEDDLVAEPDDDAVIPPDVQHGVALATGCAQMERNARMELSVLRWSKTLTQEADAARVEVVQQRTNGPCHCGPGTQDGG